MVGQIHNTCQGSWKFTMFGMEQWWRRVVVLAAGFLQDFREGRRGARGARRDCAPCGGGKVQPPLLTSGHNQSSKCTYCPLNNVVRTIVTH